MSPPDTSDTTATLIQAIVDDIAGLDVIFSSQSSRTLFDAFFDYDAYLKTLQDRSNTRTLIRKLSGGRNIIKANKDDRKLRDIFYTAHIAACCALMKGWTLPHPQNGPSNFRESVESSLRQQHAAGADIDSDLSNRIHNADSVRTIQLLRLLGLLDNPSAEMRQLSIAAGSGSRDIEGVHMKPVISVRQNTISFDAIIDDAEHISLIDNGPEYADYYTALNQRYDGMVTAYNQHSDDVLQLMSKRIDDGRQRTYNALVGLRIDHLMISDIERFFSQLSIVLDDKSDLILTVGAGHSLEEFAGRKKLMQDVFVYLKKKKMSPVRLILHGDGTVKQQRSSPRFGHPAFTTFDIVYCKLKRSSLT